ncbi:MAG: branched-chain amino acid aminotransferase [Planctomycetota bacterium]|jgi:branched-chain amino acid aminotransferase
MSTCDSLPVWVDGRFLEPGEAAISAEDPGFLLGLAVFDTLLCEGGQVFFIEDHLQRLVAGALVIGIIAPEKAVLRSGVHSVAEALGERPAGIRLTLTPGAPGAGVRFVITTRAWQAPSPEGVSVMLVPRAKLSGSKVELLKTTSRARNALALKEARSVGAWEALLGTDEGDLSEGTVSNLFIVVNGELRTPSLERGCLPGIVRSKIIELANLAGEPCVQCSISPDDLRNADEVFLTSSLARIQPVNAIRGLRDDLPLGGGPRTRALQLALSVLEMA